ncbi:MAG: glycosyl hydrolase family 28 protein [Saprospiraceae bacterium]
MELLECTGAGCEIAQCRVLDQSLLQMSPGENPGFIFIRQGNQSRLSTDAIDIDACSMVLIKGCYMSVNDDAIALKGGKGPFADRNPLNGKNSQILIEGCEFGFCHAALTCGSESIHNKNILMRNCVVKDALRLLWLKMRPDTPQKYEFISLENIAGQAHSLLYIKPWTQFFDLKGREDVPLSYSENITLKNIDFECDVFFDVAITEHDKLSNFTFKYDYKNRRGYGG